MLTTFHKSRAELTMDLHSGSNTNFKDQVRLEPLVFSNQSYDVLRIDNCIVESITIVGCKIERLIIQDSKVRGSIDVMNSSIGCVEMQGNFAQAINIDVGLSLKNLQVENNLCQLNFKNSKEDHSGVSIKTENKVQRKSLIDSSLFVKL